MEGINSLNCSDLIHLTKPIPIKNKFHHKQQVSYTYPPKNNFPNEKKTFCNLAYSTKQIPPKEFSVQTKILAPKLYLPQKTNSFCAILKISDAKPEN